MWMALLVALAAPPIDTARLEAALAGVPTPVDFKAVVVVLDPGDAAGRWFGWQDTADDTDWYPASSLKIFPAVAALELVDGGALGAVGPSVELRFERPGRPPYRRRLDWLVGQALTQSSNLAFDRLVQLVGVDALHADLLGPARGFGQTAVQLRYSDSVDSLLEAPAIQAGAVRRPASESAGVDRCTVAPSCTSVAALAELMRRIMLHEALPAGERLRLKPRSLAVLRGALGARKPRGTEVADALVAAHRPRAVRVWHKPGFYPWWRSDVVYGEVAGGRRWIVALAGRGKRDALTAAAGAIGRALAAGRL
ncbi:MAG: serine hydrolase [Myxococcales bacterium]|nr:serine hydrolase [Myxococcales bacterium]